MNIAVCVKQAVDTEAVIELGPDGSISRENQTLVIDPYSEFAVERAVQLKEAHGGEVVVITVGDQGCTSTVRHALAMGADRAVLVEDEAWLERDAAACAIQLSEILIDLDADLIMGGWKSSDTGSAQVIPYLAALLNLPCASMATGLEICDEGMLVTCEVDDGLVVTAMALPAVVAAQQGLAEPRYPSVRDIMQARKKPILTRYMTELTIDHDINLTARVRVISRSLKPPRTGGRLVEGGAAEATAEVVRLLRDEAKVI